MIYYRSDSKHFSDLKDLKPIWRRWQNSPILNIWNETGSHAPHCTQVCGGFFSYPVESVSVAFTCLCRSESVRQSQHRWRQVSSGRALRGGGRGKKAFAGGQTTSEAEAVRVIGEGYLHVCVRRCVYSCFTLNRWVGRRQMRTRTCACAAFRMRVCGTSSVCVSGSVSVRCLSQQAGGREASSLGGQISRADVTLKLLSVVRAYSIRFSLRTQELNVAQRQSHFFPWLIPFSGLTRREMVQSTDSKSSTDWAETRRRCFLY